MFKQDVIADGIHERSEALGMQDFSLTQGRIEADKGLLANIFRSLPGLESRAQFDVDQFAEVGAKVLLRTKVSCAQTLNVSFIKGVKLQERPPGVGKWLT